MLENAFKFNLRRIIYLNILGVSMPLDPQKFLCFADYTCIYQLAKLCIFTRVIAIPSAVPVNKSLLRACVCVYLALYATVAFTINTRVPRPLSSQLSWACNYGKNGKRLLK